MLVQEFVECFDLVIFKVWVVDQFVKHYNDQVLKVSVQQIKDSLCGRVNVAIYVKKGNFQRRMFGKKARDGLVKPSLY